MTLQQLFDLAIQVAMDADPRSIKEIKEELKRIERKQKELKGKEKELADPERTKNPYSDSRIHHGTGKEAVKHLMVGIDIETSELLLARELKRQGKKIDAVLAHHPSGRALTDLEKVVPLQIDIYKLYGIPENRTEGTLRPRMEQIWNSIHANNHLRTAQAAALLNIPFFNCHTISDNLVWKYMEEKICKTSFHRLGDAVDALLAIPEYAYYAQKGNPPIIIHGSKESRTGKIVASEFTGGTNGSDDLIMMQAEAGVGTILTMHMKEDALKLAKEHHINVIQCSHMAADTLGMNLLIDFWQKKGAKLDILECSGFVRRERGRK